MSSDSSDDENLAKLREATDAQFISDDMFSKKTKKANVRSHQNRLPPTLRKNKEAEDEQFNHFRLTPEFQNYVAKHLTTILDKHLETIEKRKKHKPNHPKPFKSQIKLLKESKQYLTEEIEPQTKNSRKKRPQFTKTDEQNAKLAATTLENITDEVKNWSKRSKAPVYRYMQNAQGKLVEI